MKNGMIPEDSFSFRKQCDDENNLREVCTCLCVGMSSLIVDGVCRDEGNAL